MTSSPLSKRLRLEALVAYPPTARCKEVLALLKALVADFPDQVCLDIYYAGESSSATPTRGYQGLDKRKTVPSGYINGRMLLSGDLPALDVLHLEIEEELRAGPTAWQD